MLRRDDLHEYQRFCVRFLLTHPEALLFLSMGLGKTIICLTAILDMMYDYFCISKVLVICPKRVCKTWVDEAKRFEHTKGLKLSVLMGTPAERIKALNVDADIYVVNQEWLKKLCDYLDENRVEWPFDCVIVDEIQNFKSVKSQRWKALRKVRHKIGHFIGLTGTPTPRSLEDLFGIVGLADGGKRLGRFIGRFRDEYFIPGNRNPYTGVIFNYTPKPDAMERITEKISDIAISMKSLDYLDMPELVNIDHVVEMDADEREVYEQMKKELVIELDGEVISAANAAVLSGKLQQMAGGLMYGEDGNVVHIHDRKLTMLDELIDQSGGSNIMIVYWFRHERDLIMKHLQDLGYEPRDIKTDQDIDDWNEGKIQISLMAPLSCGVGTNLQRGGNIQIWVTPIFNYGAYSQAVSRIYRQGQKDTVVIHHILCKDSIDEDIMAALARKDTTQQDVISAVRARLK